jgi:SPP1 gp7 family putative phage head morphogenesis protein
MPTAAERLRAAEEYVRRHIWALEQAAVNELYALYQQAYERMLMSLQAVFLQSVDGGRWTAADMRFRARTEYLLAQIEAEAERLMGAAAAQALTAAGLAYRAGYYGRAWVIEGGLGIRALSLPLLPVEAIRAQILLPYVGSTFLDRFETARDEFERAIRRSLVQSQIAGDGIFEAQKRLADALGIDIGRRTAAAKAANMGYFRKTEVIARTEILRASNLGAMAVYERNADVLAAWEFIATNDERTCPICGRLDGQQFPIGGGPLPPTNTHPNCRCSVLPVLVDQALQDAIAGRRKTYAEWAAERRLAGDDGGVFSVRGQSAPRSPSQAAQAAAGA